MQENEDYSILNFVSVYRARRPLESDADALAKARREAAGEVVEDESKPYRRKETATDDLVSRRVPSRFG